MLIHVIQCFAEHLAGPVREYHSDVITAAASYWKVSKWRSKFVKEKCMVVYQTKTHVWCWMWMKHCTTWTFKFYRVVQQQVEGRFDGEMVGLNPAFFAVYRWMHQWKNYCPCQSCLKLLQVGFPWVLGYDSWSQKNLSLLMKSGWSCSICLHIVPACNRRTDRQTVLCVSNLLSCQSAAHSQTM